MLSRPNTALSQIHLQIMWSRLIAVVEEQAQTLVRTAFSTPVREAGDLSAGVFDRDGKMLAQAVTGTPGHVNSMAAAVKHFLDAFPLATMKPGDHYITNDPWLTCGHLHDLTVVSPTFLRGEPVGLFASTVHVVDIGGLGMGPDGRQVFEEGLSIPLMPLAREGRMNEDLLRILRANVREPLQVEGDVYALAACNDEGSRRLVEMMEEFGLANLDRLGEHIIETSRAATIEPPPLICGFHNEDAPSAGTPSGITCSRQPNTRSGSMWPTVWRAATGNGRGTLSRHPSGALTVTVDSEPALLGTSGATRHFTPKAV